LAGALALVPAQVDDVLGELAAVGLVTSDGFSALRALIGASTRRMVRRRRPAPTNSGRWTLLRSELTPAIDADVRAEHWCRLLLRRYGVMFRDLLANESAAPRWFELARAYRKLEARGEIRGGRFVAEVAGEQFALPEVISLLRSADADNRPLVLPATDPLNLSGRWTGGPRVPALPGQTIRIVDGKVEAVSPTSPSVVQPSGIGMGAQETSTV
jgi:ATP-dependent Lhr-like helicase